MYLTPDAARLVVAVKDGLRVWDLRRIRAELVNLGLDWNLPPYPPLPPDQPTPPLAVGLDYTNVTAPAKPR